MKKKLKEFKLKNLMFSILVLITGVVIGGVAGVAETTTKLESKYVTYTKAGETMTVQDAVKDLYIKSANSRNKQLPLGDVTVSGTQVTIPYTGTYDKVACVYGTTENYGSTGIISEKTCTFTGTTGTKYYYKLIATKIENNRGTIYKKIGNITVG